MMPPSRPDEFGALRATIRSRGTARVVVFVGGFVGWAALVLATVALTLPPAAVLFPLLVLCAVFEAVFSLHVGVERIGRYLQVFHREDDRWERAAMAFVPAPGTTTDPLFTALFGVATLMNLGPMYLGDAVPAELLTLTLAHLLFLGRLIVARRAARHQRAADLERFQLLRSQLENSPE